MDGRNLSIPLVRIFVSQIWVLSKYKARHIKHNIISSTCLFDKALASGAALNCGMLVPDAVLKCKRNSRMTLGTVGEVSLSRRSEGSVSFPTYR
jgi:hypothetical protein